MIARRARSGSVFGVPIVLALVSLGGLIVGLLDDGWYDVLAASAIAVPVGVIGWSLLKARRAG